MGRLHVVGDRALRVLHAALNLHEIVVLIGAQVEDGDDRGLARLDRTLEIIQVRRTGDLIFERPHDRVLHFRRRCAGVADQHLNRGRVGAWKLLLHERRAGHGTR